MKLHTPLQPTWKCAGCGREWPCLTKRAQLLAEFRGASVSLSLLMGSHFVRASADLYEVSAGALRARFVGWLEGDTP